MGVDFYGDGDVDGSPLGYDDQPIITDANLGLFSGKGIDLLSCYGGVLHGVAGKLIGVGATFVLGYMGEVVVPRNPEDLRLVATAKSLLYQGATCSEAYDAQIRGISRRVLDYRMVERADLADFMQSNLDRYRRRGHNNNASWSVP